MRLKDGCRPELAAPLEVLDHPWWKAVLRWPAPAGSSVKGEPGQVGLRGEAKLAWLQMFRLAGGVDATLDVLVADLGAEQGGDHNAGRRMLQSLESVGLLKILGRRRGCYTVHLFDPLVAEKGFRLRSAENPGQVDLPGIDRTPTSPPEGAGPTEPETVRFPGPVDSSASKQNCSKAPNKLARDYPLLPRGQRAGLPPTAARSPIPEIHPNPLGLGDGEKSAQEEPPEPNPIERKREGEPLDARDVAPELQGLARRDAIARAEAERKEVQPLGDHALDPLAITRAAAGAREAEAQHWATRIVETVGDTSRGFKQVALTTAWAVVNGPLKEATLSDALDVLRVNAARGGIDNKGGYFRTMMKRRGVQFDGAATSERKQPPTFGQEDPAPPAARTGQAQPGGDVGSPSPPLATAPPANIVPAMNDVRAMPAEDGLPPGYRPINAWREHVRRLEQGSPPSSPAELLQSVAAQENCGP